MKKFIITSLMLTMLCLASCTMASWVNFNEDHIVEFKIIGSDGTKYKLMSARNRPVVIYAQENLANVGDIIRYENGHIVVIKKDAKPEVNHTNE